MYTFCTHFRAVHVPSGHFSRTPLADPVDWSTRTLILYKNCELTRLTCSYVHLLKHIENAMKYLKSWLAKIHQIHGQAQTEYSTYRSYLVRILIFSSIYSRNPIWKCFWFKISNLYFSIFLSNRLKVCLFVFSERRNTSPHNNGQLGRSSFNFFYTQTEWCQRTLPGCFPECFGRWRLMGNVLSKVKFISHHCSFKLEKKIYTLMPNFNLQATFPNKISII